MLSLCAHNSRDTQTPEDPARRQRGINPASGILRGLRVSGVMGAQRQGFRCTWPNSSVTSWGELHGKKIKHQGQYADHIFILLTQIQNFSHGACCELFKGKKAEIILELARKGGLQGGCNTPEQSVVLFRRGCAWVPDTATAESGWSGALILPKSSLILPNQG